MNELLRALWRDPDAWEGWLVLADWLDEREDARGELIRLIHEHQRLAPPGRRRAIDALIIRNRARWEAGLDLPDTLQLRWHRGFVVGVWVRALGAANVAGLARLLAHPSGLLLRMLDFENAPGMMRHLHALAALPGLDRIRELNLGHTRPSLPQVRELLDTWPLTQLTHLVLRSSELGDEAVAVLAGARWPELVHLDLAYNAITDEGAACLASSTTMPRLTHLSLPRNRLTALGARLLVETASMPLELLELEGQMARPAELLEAVAGARSGLDVVVD